LPKEQHDNDVIENYVDTLFLINEEYTKQLIKANVSNRRGMLIDDMVKMIKGYTDKEINIVCDQRNEMYGSNL
jgi:hypothetical protein